MMAIAAEFGNTNEVTFNRPLVVKKPNRKTHHAYAITGFGFVEDFFLGNIVYAKCETEEGYEELPIDLFSFTDRIRVLRRATRFVEKIVRDK